MSFRLAGARDCGPCQKWAKRAGFVAFPKTMAGVGRLKRICKDAFSVAGAVQETMFIRAVRRSGRWFPERGCILEHQIFRFVEMILHDGCSTSYDLVVLTSKNEKVSQTCFVFAVIKFKNWGSLAELLHFWWCQVQKLRKSRRIASFSSLQIDR